MKFICYICGHHTSRKQSLRSHKQIIHLGKNQQCRVCDYQATRKDNLTQHQAAVHECKNILVAYVTTRQHSHKQSKHKGKRYSCDLCDYQTPYIRIISQNMKARNIPVTCDSCEYQTTSTSRSLTVHKQSKHECKKFPCDSCDYQATYRGDLTTHKQSKHEGKKYRAIQIGSLNTHKQ